VARKSRRAEGVGCEVTELFAILGKPHMLDILHHVLQEAGPVRFVALQRALGLSPNTLSDRLRQLVEVGLLSRKSYDEIPPRVDYEATPKARDLHTVFESLAGWAARHDLAAAESR
jgi:DNA-binding HxlR family transcriptional regulator